MNPDFLLKVYDKHKIQGEHKVRPSPPPPKKTVPGYYFTNLKQQLLTMIPIPEIGE